MRRFGHNKHKWTCYIETGTTVATSERDRNTLLTLANIPEQKSTKGTMATAAANEILTEWETSLKTFRGHKKSAAALLPSALQLYKLGLFLDAVQRMDSSPSAAASQQEYAALQRGYHELLRALPAEYRESLWRDLHRAFWGVLRGDSMVAVDVREALQSVSQLVEGSSLAAQSSKLVASIEDLSTLLDCYVKSDSDDKSTRSCILSLFGNYLLHSPEAAEYEQLLPALHCLQQESHVWNELVAHLNAQDRRHHHHHRNHHWKERVLRKFNDDESQQEYLTSLLATGGHAEEEMLAQQLSRNSIRSSSNNKKKPGVIAAATNQPQTTTTADQEIQRRIDQVKAVLPDYGDGFVETALAASRGDVEATVAQLLNDESQWPAILRATDRKLPRRKHDFASSKQQQEREEAEAKAIARATLAAAERQQEQEAFMVDLVMRTGAGDDDKNNVENDRNDDDDGDSGGDDDIAQVQASHSNYEYNDDYDDQYDDLDGVGNTDAGLYDNYDAVRVYNQALKQVGVEQSFWEQERNTNLSQKVASSRGKKKDNFGPDRMKGGRIPGQRGRGGRGGGRGGAGDGGAASLAASSQSGGGGSEGNKGASGKPNLRQKARKLDKRREQQKKAQVKRSGA